MLTINEDIEDYTATLSYLALTFSSVLKARPNTSFIALNPTLPHALAKATTLTKLLNSTDLPGACTTQQFQDMTEYGLSDLHRTITELTLDLQGSFDYATSLELSLFTYRDICHTASKLARYTSDPFVTLLATNSSFAIPHSSQTESIKDLATRLPSFKALKTLAELSQVPCYM